MKGAQLYLIDVMARLAASQVVAGITVISEHVSEDRGYFRARPLLTNGDLLELSEYFIIQAGIPVTQGYRYQWMDPLQKLVKRWDNAEHFPGLPNFPHHVHDGDERHVIPGRSLSTIELIELIELQSGCKLVGMAED